MGQTEQGLCDIDAANARTYAHHIDTTHVLSEAILLEVSHSNIACRTGTSVACARKPCQSLGPTDCSDLFIIFIFCMLIFIFIICSSSSSSSSCSSSSASAYNVLFLSIFFLFFIIFFIFFFIIIFFFIFFFFFVFFRSFAIIGECLLKSEVSIIQMLFSALLGKACWEFEA